MARRPEEREKDSGRERERRRRERGVAREREKEKEGEGKREGEREGREEDFPPPASSRDGSNFRREETLGERKCAGEKKRLLPVVPSRRK